MVNLLTALNQLYPDVAKTTVPKITALTSINAVADTVAVPLDAGIYKNCVQMIYITGANFPLEGDWLSGNYSLVCTTRNGLGVVSDKILDQWIQSVTAKTITVLVPERYIVRADGVSGYIELRTATGLPKCAVEVSLNVKPYQTAFGWSVQLMGSVGVTGEAVVRGIKDDVGPGIKLAYKEYGKSSYGAPVAVSGTEVVGYTLPGNGVGNSLTVMVNGLAFYKFIEESGIENGESLNLSVDVF
jgi:hypothetical protein